MNALNSENVPVKAELTSLAQLVRLWMRLGITSTAELARETQKSERAIRKAKEQIVALGHLHPERTFLPPGSIVPPPRNYDSAPGTMIPSDNLPHGENSCVSAPSNNYGTVRLHSAAHVKSSHDKTEHEVASTELSNFRAREDLSLAGPQSSLSGGPSLAGSSLQDPQSPTPSPKATLETMIERLAPMLPGESERERERYAEEHLRNLMHSYEAETVNKAITRLVQRRLDGYEVKSYSRMLEALCGDVERSLAAGNTARDERIPIGAIPLPGGGYVSRWS